MDGLDFRVGRSFRRAFAQTEPYKSAMKSLLTLLALALVVSTRLSAAAPAATPEREAVLQVVQQFFDALHAKDAAADQPLGISGSTSHASWARDSCQPR